MHQYLPCGPRPAPLALPPAPPLVRRPFALAHPALFLSLLFASAHLLEVATTAEPNAEAVQVASNAAKAAADTAKPLQQQPLQ